LSGGAVTDLYNKELIFGKENFEQGGIIVASNDKNNHERICNEIREIVEKSKIYTDLS
jgi:3'(2'), 5'-bisphosphate nucleotidase